LDESEISLSSNKTKYSQGTPYKPFKRPKQNLNTASKLNNHPNKPKQDLKKTNNRKTRKNNTAEIN
jgi:hypothetical protein